ncbi:hypothetical protein AZOA_18810 [Azoarcus sp. Aa7]|nr:hypothetical protein [Azoarcus sp. Aa7]
MNAPRADTAELVADEFAFLARMLHVTHSRFDRDPDRIERVRRRFMQSADADGARFERPMRVNRQRRPG